ncbi:hypothetical protein Plhal304r1_c024g0083381 [Plasmopara halstedii]
MDMYLTKQIADAVNSRLKRCWVGRGSEKRRFWKSRTGDAKENTLIFLDLSTSCKFSWRGRVVCL